MGDSSCGIGFSRDSVATCANHPQRIGVAHQQDGGQHWCSHRCIDCWVNHMEVGFSGRARGSYVSFIGGGRVAILALLLKRD